MINIDWNITAITGEMTPDVLDFGASGITEILQNLKHIFSTQIGSVILFRDFGIDGDILDKPINQILINQIISEIMLAARRWEPRAKIYDVRFSVDPDIPGNLQINAVFDILTTDNYQGPML